VTGTSGSDDISGHDGNDHLDGGPGNDETRAARTVMTTCAA